MANFKLRDVALGSPAAERDKGLRDYFIESDAFQRVANGEKRILIGNRGSGKSAIFQYLAQSERKVPHTSVIELSPEDYSYELLRESMASEDEGSWRKQSAYAAAWKYLLYVLAMKEVSNSGGKPGRGTALGKISAYIRDNHQGGQSNKLSALISYLKRLEGVKVGKFEAGLKTRELEKLYKLEELTLLLPALKEVLERQRIIVLVDELDKGWDESEDAKAFVAGLFQACQTLNSISPNFRLYMSLRQELYENIPALYEDAQKLRDVIETIRWDEKGLRRLIAQRIRHALSASVGFKEASDLKNWSDEKLWNSIFAETLTYRQAKAFNYIVDRTLYRPREIIQFCSQIIDQATEEERIAPLDYPTIVTAEHSYSEDRAKDIAAEYRFQYPDLVVVFEAFRGRTYTFDRDELELLCLDIIVADRPASVQFGWLSGYNPDDLIDVLWRVGFLKAYAVGGIKGQARSGSTYLGPYQVASLSMQSITRFQVHPMYRSWLAMRELKSKSYRDDESN